jgi:hypothetical protein
VYWRFTLNNLFLSLFIRRLDEIRFPVVFSFKDAASATENKNNARTTDREVPQALAEGN